MKKKSKKYMSEENFNLLVESLNQAIEYERGERDDLRVTIVSVPPRTSAESATASYSIRFAVARELSNLSDGGMQQVADFIAFLKFKELHGSRTGDGDTPIDQNLTISKENLKAA
ncbi:MAG: hypothetical protein ACREEM_18765 [Blastocatellia bacterium]